MKKIRFVALALAMLMLCLTAVACNSGSAKVGCTISLVIDDKAVLDSYACKVPYDGETMPTVLDALKTALDKCDVPYIADANSVTSITIDGTEYKNGPDAEGANMCGWVYTADGVAPESGRAGTNAIAEGQVIVFTFTKTPMGGEE